MLNLPFAKDTQVYFLYVSEHTSHLKREGRSMNGMLSRREFGAKLATLVSGTTILAQLPSCASSRQPIPTARELGDELKSVGGEVLTDDAPREAAAADFGQIIHRRPIAVLKPRAPEDIAKMVELANRRAIKVAMRGQGHSMFGQTQVEGGVVIDSSGLNLVRMITFRGAPAIEAGAGALWGQVVDLAYAGKLTPVVNVDPVYLSVGGTISTGGFGGTSWRDGFQTDHVLELQVATGKGKLVTCSDDHNSDLFNAALGGMGQCGLIAKATLELAPAPSHVRLFVLSYVDLEAATADMMAIVEDGRFDHVDGRSALRQGGGFSYNLEAGTFYNAPNAPDDSRLFASLRFDSQSVRTMTYVEYYRRQPSLPSAPHPWLYLCLPASKYLAYARRVFGNPAEFAYSSPRFSVWRRNSIKRPLTPMPNEALVVRFQCSRLPPPSADMTSVLAMNRTLYERAREMGGTRLTTSAIALSQTDWIQQYGPAWTAFSAAKRRFDPNNVLTPGPGMFPG
jgi:cytokinin dehydrogenase